MAETSHARSRRAAILGLVLQVGAAAGAMVLAGVTTSFAMQQLCWLLSGGVILWVAALLVFRQHELAALEAMDLEELRRERRAGGGGEALFGEAAGLTAMVAHRRLEWMERWLVPFFGLAYAAFMIGVGLWSFGGIQRVEREEHWKPLTQLELGLILHAVLMLLLFFCSRYASGLGRVPQWRLLRACGSFMLGGAIVSALVWAALGVNLYAGAVSGERWLAWIIPWLMVVLGAEALINFLLDIYRPRSPGAESRACFDSRLLGLISEPGGIAASVAEAINYQFGFRVSQTWFYQLCQRALLPLMAVGAAAVWLLSMLVIVFPYERVIVERFGRQVNADAPWGPGVHWKLPWPIDVARKFNTDQLHEFFVGYQVGYLPDEHAQTPGPGAPVIEQWTDARHAGRDHFDFLIAPPPELEPSVAEPPEDDDDRPLRDRVIRTPVNLARSHIVVQYRILPEGLRHYTTRTADPEALLRSAAWSEMIRLASSTHIDALMGPQRERVADLLRERLTQRAAEHGLGLEIVHVGILLVHPERSVAEAFRQVVRSQQEKIAEVRKARVTENEVLSRVAGDRDRAVTLAQAVDGLQMAEVRRAPLERALRAFDPAQAAAVRARIEPLEPLFLQQVEAGWRLTRAREDARLTIEEFELGMGRSVQERRAVEHRGRELEAALEAAETAVQEALWPIRETLHGELPEAAELVATVIEHTRAQVALEFWNGRLERSLTGLEGDAAVKLSQAQARRWELEMRAAGEVSRLENERFAYQAAPEIYTKRRYLQVLTKGLMEARKYFLAFDPGDRNVHVRLEVQEAGRPGLAEASIEQN